MVVEDIITFSDIEVIVQEVIEQILKPRFRQLGMNATGQWISTIDARGNEVWGMDYTEYLVNGRRPGKMPPIAPILKWVQAKFGLTGQSAMSRAYAVAHTIAEEGTTWYKKGGTDLLAILNEKETTDFINRRINEIARENVKKELIKEIKTRF